jgi:hypothetical protein
MYTSFFHVSRADHRQPHGKRARLPAVLATTNASTVSLCDSLADNQIEPAPSCLRCTSRLENRVRASRDAKPGVISHELIVILLGDAELSPL